MVTIQTVQEAKTVILLLKSKIDSQTKSATIKLDSKEELILDRAKKVLYDAKEYAISEQGMYYTITKNRTNGLFTGQWLPVRDNVSSPEMSLEALFVEAMKSAGEVKEVTNAGEVTDSAEEINI